MPDNLIRIGSDTHIKESKSFDLKLSSDSPDKKFCIKAKLPHHKKDISHSGKKLKYIPLDVIGEDSFSKKTLLVKVADLARILDMRGDDVKKLSMDHLEKKLQNKILDEPTNEELKRVKTALHIKDEEGISLLRQAKKIKRERREVALPSDCIVDASFHLYKKVDDRRALCLNTGEMVEDWPKRLQNIEASQPNEALLGSLTAEGTGLNRKEASELLQFAHHCKVDRRDAFRYRGIDLPFDAQEGLYISKEMSGLPRSLFIDAAGRMFFLLKGHGIKKLGRGSSKTASLAVTDDGSVIVNASATLLKGSQKMLSFGQMVNLEAQFQIEKEIFQKLTPEHQYLLKSIAFTPIYEHKGARKIGYFTEYCDGGDLNSDFLKGIGEKAKWQFILNIMIGLNHLHQLGYVHGDLKKANILIKKMPDGNLEPRIIDFGTAKRIGEDFQASSTTFEMQPPEIGKAYSDNKGVIKAEPSMDVFALGTLLYQLEKEQEFPPWFQQFASKQGGSFKAAHPFGKRHRYFEHLKSMTVQEQTALGLEQPDPRSPEYIIYQMLHPAPEKRLALQDAIQQVQKIIENMP